MYEFLCVVYLNIFRIFALDGERKIAPSFSCQQSHGFFLLFFHLQKMGFIYHGPCWGTTLVLDVCDETDIAELKLKVGGFEMHLRRNVGAPRSPPHIVSPTTAPPIPSEPMANQSLQHPRAHLRGPLRCPPPTECSQVGSFRSGRTIKGRKQPPSFKEGDLIDEGQIIGYLDQFGNELPVKSDVAGEVLKILCKDGDAVGYGDPLVAVLPSFHSTIL
ncbi:unnamed protein product [Spirodela intermedia]|uniref:Lipoyl-binding domain-containing protein n=1 Tax=Spirodela intermedia TaxID=51605 RepID=A0A7I8IW82_SPIIN|nr:unnamed protein product [Spirodela intermedia]CAA6661844.1 unnamed protein product [Spirodela intermedia]